MLTILSVVFKLLTDKVIFSVTTKLKKLPLLKSIILSDTLTKLYALLSKEIPSTFFSVDENNIEFFVKLYFCLVALLYKKNSLLVLWSDR